MTESPIESMGSRIASVRRQLGLTQLQFAERLGVSKSYLAQVETGRGRPSLEMLVGMTRLGWCDSSWLLTGVNTTLHQTVDGSRVGSEELWKLGQKLGAGQVWEPTPLELQLLQSWEAVGLVACVDGVWRITNSMVGVVSRSREDISALVMASLGVLTQIVAPALMREPPNAHMSLETVRVPSGRAPEIVARMVREAMAVLVAGESAAASDESTDYLHVVIGAGIATPANLGTTVDADLGTTRFGREC